MNSTGSWSYVWGVWVGKLRDTDRKGRKEFWDAGNNLNLELSDGTWVYYMKSIQLYT